MSNHLKDVVKYHYLRIKSCLINLVVLVLSRALVSKPIELGKLSMDYTTIEYSMKIDMSSLKIYVYLLFPYMQKYIYISMIQLLYVIFDKV